jgi:threonylcarbamoyladenosine tRNA methylthiotransferase MtaB
MNLLKLLKELVKIKGLGRIRLSSIEISEVSDTLINFLKSNRKMCRHLHIPLQSGCDKILNLMKRPYRVKYFFERLKKIRRALPKIAVSADVIVGFPGETKKDFKETEKFIEKMKFSDLHIFSFSPRPGTAAEKMPDKVGSEEIKKRAEILRELKEKMLRDYKNKFLGKILEVVVENNCSSRTGKKHGSKIKGKTDYYFDVFSDRRKILSFPAKKKLKAGELVKMKIGKNSFDR